MNQPRWARRNKEDKTVIETIFEMIRGGCTVVYADQERNVIVVYNHYTTFRCYVPARNGYREIEGWMTANNEVMLMGAAQLWDYCEKHFALIDEENRNG